MIIVEFAFFIISILLLYIYFGYPLVLGILSLLRINDIKIDRAYKPFASLIIAAYNEEKVIAEKIKNTLMLNYPKEKLEIIVFSDASTDRTDEVVKEYENKGIKLLRLEGRKGKTYCQNEAVKIANGEIIVFSDANSMYEPDAIKNLVRNFADNSVGCVSGELRYKARSSGVSEGVQAEKTYWRYEQRLKKLESRVSSLVTANGAIYAVRKLFYEPLYSDIVSDFIEPLKIVQKDFRVIHEPDAVAWENTSEDSSSEFNRRVRIVSSSVYSLLRDRSLLSLLNPFRYGIFSVQLWSHKVLRWLSGVFLLLIFIFNLFLLGHNIIYTITFIAQIIFYLFALWGFLNETVFNRKVNRVSHISYYFCLSCYAMLKGVYYAFMGYSFSTWEPVRAR